MSTKVYRYRVKSLNGLLNKQARAVSYVWNFCNNTQKHALQWGKRWPTGFDLDKLTAGSSKELGIHPGTIPAQCRAITSACWRCSDQAARTTAFSRFAGRDHAPDVRGMQQADVMVNAQW